MRKSWVRILIAIPAVLATPYLLLTRVDLNPRHAPGDVIDAFNGVEVHYNGAIEHTQGRNLGADGYNIGLRHQCVEFVKRYYYQRFGHRMPDSYGHARDFFDPAVADGGLNRKRGLLQFRHGGTGKPRAEDILVFSPWLFNRYGHVAIVTRVDADSVEIVQQNPGPFGSPRERYPLTLERGRWRIGHDRALGWLRLAPPR